MSINDVAISAFFGLCVPAVSDGLLEQTFPRDQVIALTEENAEGYDPGNAKAWKIQTDLGLVVFETEDGWARIITGEGDPKDALELFRRHLTVADGWEEGMERQGKGYVRINAMMPLRGEYSIAIVFTAQIDNSDAGFFASAILVRGNHG